MQMGARGAMPSIPGGMHMQQGPPGPMTQLLQQDGPPPPLHGSPALLNAPGISEVLHSERHTQASTQDQPQCLKPLPQQTYGMSISVLLMMQSQPRLLPETVSSIVCAGSLGSAVEHDTADGGFADAQPTAGLFGPQAASEAAGTLPGRPAGDHARGAARPLDQSCMSCLHRRKHCMADRDVLPRWATEAECVWMQQDKLWADIKATCTPEDIEPRLTYPSLL